MSWKLKTALPWMAVVCLFVLILLTACALNFDPGQNSAPEPPPPTITSIALATHTAAPGATQTSQATPTTTPELTATATPSLEPSLTPVPPTVTSTPRPFAVQIGSPKYIPAFAHGGKNCKWMGIAGQVFDQKGEGLHGLAVLVTGSMDGKPFEKAVLSGEQTTYGPGGFEMPLSDHPLVNPLPVVVQLYDLDSSALSDPLVLDWPNRCDENLALVNFQSIYTPQKVYLPISSNAP